MLISFEEYKGRIFSRYFGKIAFPARGFTPKVGIVYHVRIAGENPARTVYFLRNVREVGYLDRPATREVEIPVDYGTRKIQLWWDAPTTYIDNVPNSLPYLFSATGRGALLGYAINQALNDIQKDRYDLSGIPEIGVSPFVMMGDYPMNGHPEIYPLSEDAGAIKFFGTGEDTFYLLPGRYLLVHQRKSCWIVAILHNEIAYYPGSGDAPIPYHGNDKGKIFYHDLNKIL